MVNYNYGFLTKKNYNYGLTEQTKDRKKKVALSNETMAQEPYVN